MNRTGGYAAAAPLASSILEYLHRDQMNGFDDGTFPAPEEHDSVRLCGISGRRATSACKPTWEEWFPRGQAPPTACRAHTQVAIDVRNGLVATSRTPAEHVEVRTFLAIAPRYAAWAAANRHPPPPVQASDLGTERPHRAGAFPTDQIRSPASTQDGRMELVAPRDGQRFFLDPDLPPQLSTLALEAAVAPNHRQVVWYVDGKPWKVVDSPYSARWPLKRGEHTFQVRLPLTSGASPVVRITVH